MQHDWVKSTLGHGETMCTRCKITNREAAVLGKLNDCDVPPNDPLTDAEVQVHLTQILHLCMRAKKLKPLGTPTEGAALDAMLMVYKASQGGHP